MILYLETNFLIGAASGQDASAKELLQTSAESLRLVLPDICVMEAFSVLENQRALSNSFAVTLDSRIVQLGRDTNSVHARSMRAHLEQARIDNDNVFNDLQRRLSETLQKLTGGVAGYHPAELLSLPPAVVVESLATSRIAEPTDNLILAVIQNHAQQNASEEKALLSGNTKDFDSNPVRSLLSSLHIHYFSKTENFLGWFRSQS